MAGKIIETKEIEITDCISFFYKGGIFGGTVTKVTDKTVVLDNKRTIRKEGMSFIKR